jgi:acyl-CoA thioesterase-1
MTIHRAVTVVALLSLLAAGCRSGTDPAGTASRATSGVALDPAPAPPHSARPRIVVLGDSLAAGLGLDTTDAFPAILQEKIDAARLPYEIASAGVSGDTSAGGLSRLDWALGDHPQVLILALGANDGLRGLPTAELKRNLSTIIERAQARHIEVLLAGMEAPPNFGSDYTTAFHQVYSDLANQYSLPLVPFLLQDVAGIERLNQRDGIHPTAEGARIVADNVWAILRPMLTAS